MKNKNYVKYFLHDGVLVYPNQPMMLMMAY